MTDNPITTLGKFLHQSGAQYRVFDMGRRVAKLSITDFVGFENAKIAYPYPLNKQALFAIVFWDPGLIDKQYVWFLRFPLDEQGLLIQAARDEFLVMLLDRVGEYMLAAEVGKNIESALKDSPYTFDPHEEKMAAFNALVTKNLNMPASPFYDAAHAYFSGQTDKNDWQSLGMQGVADVAARLDENGLSSGLIVVLPTIPIEPFLQLCAFLENAEPKVEILEVLALRVKKELQEKKPDVTVICACLRAISNSPIQGQVELLVKLVLKHSCSQNIEILATISGRIWPLLTIDPICQLFVEQLAHNNAGQEGFNQLLADVMFMPNIRTHIMQVLRSPTRSVQLSEAVGKMFA